jgi:hypothetical protein
MTKTVSKVVVYFTDGTYQEVGGNFFGGGGGIQPFNPAPRKDIPFTPVDIEDPYVYPGKTGVWPWPPDHIGTTIVD